MSREVCNHNVLIEESCPKCREESIEGDTDLGRRVQAYLRRKYEEARDAALEEAAITAASYPEFDPHQGPREQIAVAIRALRASRGGEVPGDCWCGRPGTEHFKQPDGSKAWHCAKCRKPMQFFDGICFQCNGGTDPGY